MHTKYVGVCNDLPSKNLVNNKYKFLIKKNQFFYNDKKICYLCHLWEHLHILTLCDPGGGLKAPALSFFALTYLILELHYCALGTLPKK